MSKFAIIPATLLIMIALFLAVIHLPATAQGSPTPTPYIENWYLEATDSWNLPYAIPGTEEGNATWTLKQAEFSSRYPNGFSFSINASSDQGEVVLASVIWSHTPNQLHRLETTNIEAGQPITIRWFADESLPPWVAVNYYWSLVDSAGNRYRTEWVLGNEYADNASSWTRKESQDVIIFLQDGLPYDTITYTLEAMEAQRETYIEAWGGPLSYKPRVILFASSRDFQEWRRDFAGSGVIGQTAPEWGATVQVIIEDDPFDLAYGTVLHEIGHLYQFEYIGTDFGGGGLNWLSEGNATLFELHQQYDYEQRVRSLAANGELPLLLQGSGPFAIAAGADGRGRLGYDVGYTFWKWIVDTYGLSAHRTIIDGLRSGLDRDLVLEQVTGMPVNQIEQEWARWLGASSTAPTLVPTWTLPFRPSPTPFQFPTRDAG
ncbi:MAG: hypothetical protein H6673_02760 [Anaerolineales bacterium]|nr:hypothetical protein [Anaerolineales bacterium]